MDLLSLSLSLSQGIKETLSHQVFIFSSFTWSSRNRCLLFDVFNVLRSEFGILFSVLHCKDDELAQLVEELKFYFSRF